MIASSIVSPKGHTVPKSKNRFLYLRRGTSLRAAVTRAATHAAVQSLLRNVCMVNPDQNPDSLGGPQ